MKKVTNVTLGGRVFAVEEDAYELLSTYLKNVSAGVGNFDEPNEIIDDIETAIAEKLISGGKNEIIAVTVSDVEKVIEDMGSVEEMTEGLPDDASDASENTKKASDEKEKSRRLYRDTDDVVVGGVASGIAHYFSLDPVWVRLAFVIGAFLDGISIIAYLVLWLIVPKAETTADRYAMRGNSVNIATITERAKESITDISETARSSSGQLKHLFEQLFSVIRKIVQFIFSASRYVFGVGLVLFGVVGVIVSSLVYGAFWFTEKTWAPDSAKPILDSLLHTTSGIMLVLSSYVVILIPALVVMLLGLSALRKKNVFTLTQAVIFGTTWIGALIILGVAGTVQLDQNAEKIEALIETHQQYDYQAERYYNGEVNVMDTIDGFEIIATLGDRCESDIDCDTPADYAARSSCPYDSVCINNTCAVVCPHPFTGSEIE